MNNDTIARGQKTVMARWENKKGNRFVEVYQQTRDGVAGFGVDSHVKCSWFGEVSLSRAMASVEGDRRFGTAALTWIPLNFALAA